MGGVATAIGSMVAAPLNAVGNLIGVGNIIPTGATTPSLPPTPTPPTPTPTPDPVPSSDYIKAQQNRILKEDKYRKSSGGISANNNVFAGATNTGVQGLSTSNKKLLGV